MPADRPFLGMLFRRNPNGQTASKLYGRLVAQARDPAFYAGCGVPDTPEGRLELILVHVVLMLRRLGREEDATVPLARTLSETFVTDMDDCLREMGVGDLSVARKVKQAAAALFDRSRDYGAALNSGNEQDLANLVARHVTVAAERGPGERAIASYMCRAEALLAGATLAQIERGEPQWPTISL